MTRIRAALVTACLGVPALVRADPLTCSLERYKAATGLTAKVADDTLILSWDGDRNDEVRLRLTLESGTPTIRDLAIRRKDAPWVVVAGNATPEFRVVSGMRRITKQQLKPLIDRGITVTSEIVDREKWEAFWDAPLRITGEVPSAGSTPPAEGVAHQPGLPRGPQEIVRATASFHARSCEVKTDGARLEAWFPGVELGVFTGRLQFTVYKGTNLIRMEVIARTQQPSVAYKYDAGLKGLAIQPSSRVVWRDTANSWQDYQLGGGPNERPVPLKSNNRLVAAEDRAGSIAAFPPPHSFFWARENDTNLGYSWYRKDGASSFAFGIRQAENEEDPTQAGRGPLDARENFALYSARPGTWQRMAMYLYVGDGPGRTTIDSALAFTRRDHYEPLPGFQVMASHFHDYLVRRLTQSGSLDARLPDVEVVKAAGINIFGPIDGGAGGTGKPPSPDEYARNLSVFYEIARRHSDKNFLIMPNVEITDGELPDLVEQLGGHWDLLMSHPVVWSPARAAAQPLVENDPKYGKLYHIGSADDFMEMVRMENLLVYMPHPRSKGSTGYPDAIKETARFRDENFRGIGFRWGMGLDLSEQRLCEYRCLALLDDMNNWVADLPTPPKYLQAISEFYEQGPGDDIYANNPVNYLKLDRLPAPDNWEPIIDAMRRGDYFVTSGEVLIPRYELQGSGDQRTIVAEVTWTFPLEFVEVVWGDGLRTEHQIIPATDQPAFGRHRFQIPFNTAGKKWVRFAVWDSAGNGALVQPIKLTTPAP